MSTVSERTISIIPLLESFTKDELQHMRRMLEIKRASQLNKDELVQRLASYMLNHLEHHLKRMDLNRFNVLMKVMKAPGSLLAAIDLADNEFYEPVYYQVYGLLFLREGAVIMPQEVKDRLLQLNEKQLKVVLKRNQEWIQLTQGLLYYYGNMSVKQLVGKMEQYTGQAVEYLEYWHVISDLELYDYSVLYSAYGFSHFTVDDPGLIDREHRSRPELDYYPFTKVQALRAAEDEFVDRHEGYRQFVSFLREQWVMDKEDADLIVAELADQIQQGDLPSQVVASLQEQLEFTGMEQLQQLMNALMLLMNKTRLWALKGHSPEEVFKEERKHLQPLPAHPFNIPSASASASLQAASSSAAVYDFQTKQKVGRNDPCPCGSGKKFKKCCGSVHMV